MIKSSDFLLGHANSNKMLIQKSFGWAWSKTVVATLVMGLWLHLKSEYIE